MAEVIITSWITTEKHGEKAAITSSKESTTIRSIRTNRVNVSVLRDLMRALDEHQVPDHARITALRSETGHLIQLIAEYEREVPAKIEKPGEGNSD